MDQMIWPVSANIRIGQRPVWTECTVYTYIHMCLHIVLLIHVHVCSTSIHLIYNVGCCFVHRMEIQNIKALETRNAVRVPVPAKRRRCCPPQSRPTAGSSSDRRDRIAETMPSDDGDGGDDDNVDDDKDDDVTEPPAKVTKKGKPPKQDSLVNLIRENQTKYNKFITKKIPKLLRALGVSSSDSESD